MPQRSFSEKKMRLHRHLIDVPLVFFTQGQGAQRAQLSLKMDAGFLLELVAQGVWNEIQGVFVLGAFSDRIHRAGVAVRGFFQATLEEND